MQADVFQSSKAPLGKVVQLFGELLVVGILTGGLASLIGRFIYLILVFPVLMGLVAGAVINASVVMGKIRSALIVVAAGIFAVIVIYGSMHFFDYLWFRSDAAKVIQNQVVTKYGQAADDKAVQTFIDQFLIEKTGSPGLIGFILFEAQEGVTLSRVESSSSDSGLNLGAFTWVYWLIEMGIIGWAAISAGYKSTKQLFCEHCNEWVPSKLSEHIGGIRLDASNQVLNFIKSGDYAGLAGMLQNNIPLPSLEFYMLTCKCNTFPLYLTGQVVSQTKKGQVQSKVVLAQKLNSSQRFALTNAINLPTRTPEHVRTEL